MNGEPVALSALDCVPKLVRGAYDCYNFSGEYDSRSTNRTYCCNFLAGDKELVGTLRGFDVFVNMVLEQVETYETTPEGTRVTKLDQILLNGNNIAVLVPGGKPEGS